MAINFFLQCILFYFQDFYYIPDTLYQEVWRYLKANTCDAGRIFFTNELKKKLHKIVSGNIINI